jgi:hypothetical protein
MKENQNDSFNMTDDLSRWVIEREIFAILTEKKLALFLLS